jgi:hypothetical protein
MKYFNSLPYLTNTDSNGNTYLLRNILIRTQLIPQLASNPLLFYKYQLQDSDTPEIVANKYYGDSFRYWIVLHGNPSKMDPQGDWPLNSEQFTAYLIDKYSEVAGGDSHVLSYTQGTVHHYEKLITTVDDETRTTSIKDVWIDENTYNSLIPYTKQQTFSDGSKITYSVSSKAVSIYEYENGVNEAKRNINLINSTYANQVETQYQTLVSA